MPFHQHAEQRRWHLARHGPLHLVRHARHVSHGHHRVIVSPKVQHRRRMTTLIVAGGLLCIFGVIVVALAYSSLNRARSDLDMAHTVIAGDLNAKKLLTTAPGRAQLAQDIAGIEESADQANQALSDSTSLRVLGILPIISTQRRGLIQLSADTEHAASEGSRLLGALDNLVATSHGTTVSLPSLAGLEYYVVEGHVALAKLERPSSGLLGPIARARQDFNREDTKLEHLLSLSAQTIAFARPFLGLNGPQQYLIGGMNNAEMRDSGAVLSLDVLNTTNGSFGIEHDASYGQYALTSPAVVALPAGTEKVFGSYLPTQNWPAVDATADFALTGESMQAMWAKATGQHVAGVIGIDVPGVASILALTGPVDIPGIPVPVSASNVANLLLNQAYVGLTVNDPQGTRRDQIAAVVKAAVQKMKTEHVDIDAFANALSADVQGRHLMVWSDVPSDEAGLQALDAAGTLTSADPSRTIHLAVENSSADKLDYFVAVAVGLHVTVDHQGNALVNTTVEVANFAAAHHVASYQYGPDGVNAFTPGAYVARIFFWGPRGAVVPNSVPESGLQVTQSHFTLLPDAHNSVSFTTEIPHAVQHGHLQLRLIPQARLQPDRLKIDISAPGWTVGGPTHIATGWSGTLHLNWSLTR